MKIIVAERLDNLRPEEIPSGSSTGFFCAWCKQEVSLTVDSQKQMKDGNICCVSCYKRVVIKGGLGYVSRWRQMFG